MQMGTHRQGVLASVYSVYPQPAPRMHAGRHTEARKRGMKGAHSRGLARAWGGGGAGTRRHGHAHCGHNNHTPPRASRLSVPARVHVHAQPRGVTPTRARVSTPAHPLGSCWLGLHWAVWCSQKDKYAPLREELPTPQITAPRLLCPPIPRPSPITHPKGKYKE